MRERWTWGPNPRWSPRMETLVAMFPGVLARWKRWRRPYIHHGPIGSVVKHRYATDEELARIKLEECFGEARSETTTPMSPGS